MTQWCKTHIRERTEEELNRRLRELDAKKAAARNWKELERAARQQRDVLAEGLRRKLRDPRYKALTERT